jgi:hypothetical protein
LFSNFVTAAISSGSVGAGGGPVYRCCRCYSLLTEAISKKRKAMHSNGTTIYPIPALTTLLATSWTALAEATTKEEADWILMNAPGTHGLSTLGDRTLANNFCLEWDDGCPSCYQCEFEDPPPAIGTVFASALPSFERTIIILYDCPVLDDITGEETMKLIHIDVITCAPLMSSVDSHVFKFRAADEFEHSNYHTFVPQATPSTNDSQAVEYWQLIRSSGTDSQVLSFIRIGCLNSVINNKVRRFVVCACFSTIKS